MIYVFESSDGRRIERDYPMSNAPKVGAVIREGGVEYRRILLSPQGLVKADRNFKSRALPQWYEPHRMAGGQFDSEGNCLIDNWKTIRDTVKAARDIGDPLDYD